MNFSDTVSKQNTSPSDMNTSRNSLLIGDANLIQVIVLPITVIKACGSYTYLLTVQLYTFQKQIKLSILAVAR